MCVTSAVTTDWMQRHPTYVLPNPPLGGLPQAPVPVTVTVDAPTKAEFEALKKEMEELKQLLLAAKRYDEATGQPDCEMEEKVELITKLAKLVGVDMQEVFNNHK